MKRSFAALAAALGVGCVGAGAAQHTRPEPVATAHPEPDPACLGIVSQCPAIRGLQQVVLKIGVNRQGQVALLDVLTPELTAADTVEIRRALERCAWKPAVGPNGERVEGSFTLAIQR